MSEWAEILELVQEQIQSAKGRGRSLWFRGHRDVEWKMRSTAHRYILDLMEEGGKDIDGDFRATDYPPMIRDQFKSFYQDFKSKAWDLLAPEERQPWGIVFAMQHHGIPTTLLDLSESFAVATYFANCERLPDSDAAIYLIEPEKINVANPLVGRESLVGIGDDDPDSPSTSGSEYYHPGIAFEDFPKEEQPPLAPMAISPILINARMRAQCARFIICGDDFVPIEDRCPEAVTKIPLPAKTYQDSLEWLELVGMSSFMLFPDLEGVRKDFEDKTQKVREVVRGIRDEHKEDSYLR